jgi:cell division protein FtsI (penicillin-binding protein 3)
MMRPYIVSKITDSRGKVIKQNHPQIVRQVVSPQTAEEMKKMLRMVVLDGGTGVRAESEGYPVAGKTGTAQKLDPVTKRYSQKKYFSSFLGFVPYDKPELAILVALDEPKTKTYGGTVAAPTFREIADQVLPMLNVQPALECEEKNESDAASPVLAGQPPNKKPDKVSGGPSQKTKSAVAALAREIAQSEAAAVEGQIILASSDSSKTAVMPDLAGLSMRRVMSLMSKYEVDCTFSGSGQAVWQDPQPGKKLKPGQLCQIKFEQW